MSAAEFRIMFGRLINQLVPRRRWVEAAQIAIMARQARRDSFTSVFFAALISFILLGPVVDLDVPEPAYVYAWLCAMIFYSPALYALGGYLKLSSRRQVILARRWRYISLLVFIGNAFLWGLLSLVAFNVSSTANQALIMLVYFGLTAVYAIHVSAHLMIYSAMILTVYTMVMFGIVSIPGPVTDALTVLLPFFILFALFLGFDSNRTITGGIRRELAQKKLLRDLERARVRAEESNHAKSNFLAMMSHELRTPLNAILGFADLMRMETFGPLGTQRYASYVKDIHDSGSHLLAVLNEILELSRIDAGSSPLREEEVDIDALTHAVIGWVEERAHAGMIHLSCDINAPGISVYADPVRLKQILLNLVTNAVKYNRPSGQVCLAVHEHSSGGLAFDVSDTGIGIETRDLERIFDPFTQVEAISESTRQGVGLGLAITKRLVDQHQGTIDIHSEYGKGTTVTVVLPPDRLIRRAKAAPLPELTYV